VSALAAVPRRARPVAAAAWSALTGRPAAPGAVVLAYHDVLPDDAAGFDYAVPLRRFRAHLEVVARCGLRVVSVSELAGRLASGLDVGGHVALAFDDALVGVHHHALPALAERGWPATLHPVVDRLGVDPPWWPGSRRTMTRSELAEALGNGVEVAAHGATHACLPCATDGQLTEELRRARDVLGDLAGRPPAVLAYPYGHHDRRVRGAARQEGFTTGWTFLNGRVGPGSDHWRLPRLTMHAGVGRARLAHQLARLADQWPDSSAAQVHPAHA
jgi:peptidoglycan/xylan/chitin deacetylase (PgdA/CDA1 family)